MYESTINFTIDTVCLWTYLAKKRLDEALRIVRSTTPSTPITFTIKFHPYQLYPSASLAGEDKQAWYQTSRYGDTPEKWATYTKVMTAYGETANIPFKWTGTFANTLPAHRLIQQIQSLHPPAVVDKLVMSLFRQYFEEERHPSSEETLLRACADAGIPESEAEQIIDDETTGFAETKRLIREQEGNGVDSVPVVLIEGRRRDVGSTGAQEVGDYVKLLTQIVKESR